MRPNWWSSKSVFLAITILFFFVSAAHAATVAVGNKITLSSKTVSVPVKLKTAAGESISALNCEISYDTAVLANPKVSTGIAAKIADKEALTGSSSPGKLSFSLFGMNNKKIPMASSHGLSLILLSHLRLRPSQFPQREQPLLLWPCRLREKMERLLSNKKRGTTCLKRLYSFVSV